MSASGVICFEDFWKSNISKSVNKTDLVLGEFDKKMVFSHRNSSLCYLKWGENQHWFHSFLFFIVLVSYKSFDGLSKIENIQWINFHSNIVLTICENEWKKLFRICNVLCVFLYHLIHKQKPNVQNKGSRRIVCLQNSSNNCYVLLQTLHPPLPLFLLLHEFPCDFL